SDLLTPLLPACRQLAEKRRIHCTSINGESWLVVYGLPVAQSSSTGIVKDSRISSKCGAFDRLCQSKSLWRNANPPKQVHETGVCAKGVPECLYFDVSETIEPLLVGLFEPTKGLIFVFQSGINQGKQESRYKTVLRSRRKLLDEP